LFAFGCESDETTAQDAGEHGHAHADAAAHESDEKPAELAPYVMKTEKFTLEPGQEQYLCYATTLEEDLVIGGYSSDAQPFVHHLVFVKPLAPEPDGFAECDTLFRMTWEPLYITGAGSAKLEFPADAGHKLTKGTQLLVQMHLLNVNNEAVDGTVEIDMHRSTAKNPRPVGAYALGTSSLSLPPNQESEALGTCELKERVELIAAFPHMHLLGTKMTVDVGASADDMERVFTRDPYDFDDQSIEPLKLTLEPGDLARVTCGYNNTRSEVIGFGESTNTEMCFFIGFALDREGLGSCTQRRAPDAKP
jgi:hypothetical protein